MYIFGGSFGVFFLNVNASKLIRLRALNIEKIGMALFSDYMLTWNDLIHCLDFLKKVRLPNPTLIWTFEKTDI